MSDSHSTGWVQFSLDDLASKITSGGTPTAGSARYYSATGIPFVKIDDMTRSLDRTIDLTELHITPTAVRESAAKIFPSGTILVSMYGTIGLTKVLGLPMATNQAIAALLPEFRCNQSLLVHILDFSRQKLERASSQTTQPNISGKIIREFEVAIPQSEQEQRKIAEILDTVDEAIRSAERLIVKLEQAKQGLLRDLLTRGIDQSERLRDPNGYPNKFLDDSVYDRPASWKIATVRTACIIHDGPRHPISAEERFKLQGDFPYYGPTGVLDYIDHYRYDGTYALIGEDGDHFLKFTDRPMTQLISGRFNCNNHAHVIQGGSECLTDWFWLFFLHRDITLHLTRQGAGRFKLSQENLTQLPIVLPPLSEQRAIVDHFRLCESEIVSESAALAKLRLLKRGLMNDLLTGRVRVGASA